MAIVQARCTLCRINPEGLYGLLWWTPACNGCCARLSTCCVRLCSSNASDGMHRGVNKTLFLKATKCHDVQYSFGFKYFAVFVFRFPTFLGLQKT